VRIGAIPFAKRSVKELVMQGSHNTFYGVQGLLGSLISITRDPPLASDAFADVLRTKNFTNGADSGTVIDLYRKTARSLLGSTPELVYHGLKWSEADFERLGEALCYCGALETLQFHYMDLSDTAAAAVVAGLASCPSLKTLTIDGGGSSPIKSLTALPDLSALTSLQTLNLNCCNSLTSLPDLSALTSLQELSLHECSSLTALPDLAVLTDLKVENLPDHLEPWKAGGFKAWRREA